MDRFRVLMTLSVFGICFAAVAALPFPEPQLVWAVPHPYKTEEQDQVYIRKVREVSPNEIILPSDRQYESDIYWRPWNHYIPKDAVVGGYREGDCGRKPIYLAHVFRSSDYDAAVIPVEIFANSRSVKYPYAGTQKEARTDIRVLCCDEPTILTWVTNEEARRINVTADKDCIVGGSERSQKFHTFFGRVMYENETFIGKALHHDNVTYIPYYGEEKGFDQYEILCYKKSIEARREEALKREAEQNKAEANRKLEEEKKLGNNKKLGLGKKADAKNKLNEDYKGEILASEESKEDDDEEDDVL